MSRKVGVRAQHSFYAAARALPILSLKPVGRTVAPRTLRARVSDSALLRWGPLLEMGPRRHWQQLGLGTSLTSEKSNTGSTSKTNPERSPLPPAPPRQRHPCCARLCPCSRPILEGRSQACRLPGDPPPAFSSEGCPSQGDRSKGLLRPPRWVPSLSSSFSQSLGGSWDHLPNKLLTGKSLTQGPVLRESNQDIPSINCGEMATKREHK